MTKIANSIFKTFLLSLLIVGQVQLAKAQTASLLPNAVQQFFDNNGNPLTSGTVTTYVPSTSTLKTTWQDPNQATPWANPLTLNAAGRPPNNKGIFGDGSYRQVVKDRLNNIIWDQVTSSTGSSSGGGPTATGDGDLVGTIKPWAGMTAPNQYAFTYGQEVSRTTYAILFAAITSTQATFCTSASPTLTGLSDTTNFWVGMSVEISCVPAGFTTIISKTSSSVTMAVSANVTTNTSAVFFSWGRGNGITTFNLPDFRGFVIAGNNIMGGVASPRLTTAYFGATNPNSSGAAGGNESNTLALSQIPTGITSTNPAQSISVGTGAANIPTTTSGIGQGTVASGGGGPSFAPLATSAWNAALNQFTGSNAITVTSTNTGGLPHANVQPTKTANYIIKITPDANSATASGVTDIQGMTGSIGCGFGLSCTGNVISATISGNEATFDTLTAAAAASIPAQVNIVRTQGRIAVGDYGGASYARSPPSVAAAWRFQSADGQWWALNNRIVTPEMFGIVSGGTDNTAAFVQLATWLGIASSGGITNGGIIVNFLPGGDYRIWPSGGAAPGAAIQLANVNGVTFNFNGARIATNNTWVDPNASVFSITNSTNLIFNDPSYAALDASCTTISAFRCGLFFLVGESAAPWSGNIIWNNGTQSGGSAYVNVIGYNARGAPVGQQRGFSIINAKLQNVFYGAVFSGGGDNAFIRGLYANNVGRIYFPWNVSNHDVEVMATNTNGTFVSAMIKAYGWPESPAGKRETSNIKLVYKSMANTIPGGVASALDMQQGVAQINVSGAVNNGAGLIRLTVNSTADITTGNYMFVNSVGGVPNATGNWTVTVIDATHVDLQGSTFAGLYTAGGYMRSPASIRNVDIVLDTDSPVLEPPVINTYKENSDGSADVTTSGYTVENITIGGTAKGYDFAQPVMSLFLHNAYSVGTWVGETIRNISLKDLTIAGTSSSALIDATNIVNLRLDKVIAPSTVPFTITGYGTNVSAINSVATGIPSIRFPTTAGTVATNATTPVLVNATTGAVSCPTCVSTVSTQVFAATGTYTPSAGTLYTMFECWGAGGGGGGTANTAATIGAGAGGGGAGSYSSRLSTIASIGASQVVTIGAAGAAGASGNNAGGAGGDTSVGALCVGKGGTGGGGSAGSGAPVPGAGGVAGTGDLAGTGQSGGAFPAIANSQGYGGFGGTSSIGGGGAAVMTATTATGNAATGRGGGGGGGASFNTGGAAAGGIGGAGFVRATEYRNQ